MIEEKEILGAPTLEILLVRRVEKLLEAIDIGNGILFDEIVETVEMLLRQKPPLYNMIIYNKQQIYNQTKDLVDKTNMIATQARNEIQRRSFMESELSGIEWDARKDYLEVIITVLSNYNILESTIDLPAELEQYDEPEVEEEEPEPEPEPEPQQPPKKKLVQTTLDDFQPSSPKPPVQPKQQPPTKPKLSYKPKKEKFNV